MQVSILICYCGQSGEAKLSQLTGPKRETPIFAMPRHDSKQLSQPYPEFQTVQRIALTTSFFSVQIVQSLELEKLSITHDPQH